MERDNIDKLQAAVVKLQKNIKHGPSGHMEDDISLGSDWELMKNTSGHYMFKFTAINRQLGIVVKQYANAVPGYADAVFEALRELSEVELRTPVLQPLFVSNNALVFPLGEFRYSISYFGEYDDPENRKLLKQTFEKKGLTPLGIDDKVEVVSVDSKDYAVDPLDDSEWELFNLSR